MNAKNKVVFSPKLITAFMFKYDTNMMKAKKHKEIDTDLKMNL